MANLIEGGIRNQRIVYKNIEQRLKRGEEIEMILNIIYYICFTRKQSYPSPVTVCFY